MPMITFDNTEIAFRSKTDSELRKAYWLFKAVEKNSLIKFGKWAVNFANKINLPFSWLVRPVYHHFVGGKSIEDCLPSVRQIEKFNVKAILDYSVEGGHQPAQIQAALEETLRSIYNAGQDQNIPFAVFKPTAFASGYILEKASSGVALTENDKREALLFEERVEKLCKASFDANIPILIDAEDTFYQNFIDEVVERMMAKFNKERVIVFNTLQMYRHDRLASLKKIYEKAVAGNYYAGVKFVRGAYMEKERERAEKLGYQSPIQPDKASTDRDYNAALEFSIKHIDRLMIFNGTHNEESCQLLAQLMQQHNIQPSDKRVWFAQLYGMSDHISFNLAQAGYNVAKYVPYGPIRHVMPYLIRRAEENTSVAGQTGRELSLIQTELKRRKARSKK
jgi:proline dehydrogenase